MEEQGAGRGAAGLRDEARHLDPHVVKGGIDLRDDVIRESLGARSVGWGHEREEGGAIPAFAGRREVGQRRGQARAGRRAVVMPGDPLGWPRRNGQEEQEQAGDESHGPEHASSEGSRCIQRGDGLSSGRMRSKSLAAIFLVLFSLSVQVARAAPPPPAPDSARGFILVEGADSATLREVAEALEARGAHLPLRLAPDVLIGRLPPGLESELPGLRHGARMRLERAGGPRIEGSLPPSARAARRFLDPPRALPGTPEPVALGGDIVAPLPGDWEPQAKALPSGCGVPSATSAVLVGSVAIGILLPESMGPIEDSEDWSSEDPSHPGEDRQDLVVAKILEGCDELVAAHPEAGLSFTLQVHRSVGIPYEPIEHPVGNRGVWIDATLSAIGFGAASGSYGTGSYVRALREIHGTDWAAAAYVVDDLVDLDNGFPPTGFPFAYALLGGPYMVMTYDNDGWGIERMNTVFRHELGHVFTALDEYQSAGNTCSRTAGFLGVKNGNNDSPPGDAACETSVACFMRGNHTTTACAFTQGQLGIRDIDGNGILDVREAPPNTGFEDESPLLITVADVTLRARASALPGSGEAALAPSTWTLNRITLVEMRIDGGAWTPVTPVDGSYGDRCEDIEIGLTGLSEGWHDIELRATNDAGIVEPSPARMRLHVNADCADDASEPDSSAASAVARTAGVHVLHRCAYDADWSRFYLQAGADVTVTLAQDDPSGELLLRLLAPGGTEIAMAESAGGFASITETVAIAGVYLAVVEGDSDFETGYALTIGADCVDDPDEPDSPAPLGRPSWPGLLRSRMLCAADEDRYLVSMQSGESVQADLAFDPAFGDLDLELLDPAGLVVASSLGTGGTEMVSFVTVDEGIHVVRVFGKTPTDRNVYDLTLSATGCVDDAFENDDDAGTARLVSAGEVVRGIACGMDEDWLSFEIGTRRLVRLQLSHDPLAGNLDLELWTEAGRLVARSVRSGGSEDITSERLTAGPYRARILGTSAARVAWTFTLEEVDPLLLFVRKDPEDALLTWNRSEQECFTVRRSEDPSDFSAAVVTLVQDGDPSVIEVDRPIQDVGLRVPGVIGDGRFLYCWLVDPHDCGGSLAGSLKSVTPYPVLVDTPGGLPSLAYEIVVRNDSLNDAFGVMVRDDMPPETDSFVVDEIPPGATDASAPAPAGASARGQLFVTGIDVPAGEERVVRFTLRVAPRSTFMDPMIDNQAVVMTAETLTDPLRMHLSDDGLTSAYGDDTRVLHASFVQQLVVHAFWHRYVDVDLMVTDPCGNVLGEREMLLATCSGQEGRVLTTHSCLAPSPPSRYERITWTGFPPPSGEYVVTAGYPGAWPGDPDCPGFGPEEMTVVVQMYNTPTTWQTVTIDPGADRQEILRFTIP